MKKLLTCKEVAEILGVKLSTIYKWTHMHQIPYVKIGKLLRFQSKVIEQWISENSKVENGRPPRPNKRKKSSKTNRSAIWEKHFK